MHELRSDPPTAEMKQDVILELIATYKRFETFFVWANELNGLRIEGRNARASWREHASNVPSPEYAYLHDLTDRSESANE